MKFWGIVQFDSVKQHLLFQQKIPKKNTFQTVSKTHHFAELQEFFASFDTPNPEQNLSLIWMVSQILFEKLSITQTDWQS